MNCTVIFRAKLNQTKIPLENNYKYKYYNMSLNCAICNYNTNREDHFYRHNNSSKHSKKRYAYLQKLKEYEKNKYEKDKEEEVKVITTKEDDDDDEILNVEIKKKDEIKYRSHTEANEIIQKIISKSILLRIDLEQYLEGYNKYLSNLNRMNICEINDFCDELEYIDNKYLNNNETMSIEKLFAIQFSDINPQ